MKKALAKLRNVSAEREQPSLADAIALLEGLRTLDPEPEQLARQRDCAALVSLLEALEGDEPEAVLDAYDAACQALGRPALDLGGWLDRAHELYEEDP